MLLRRTGCVCGCAWPFPLAPDPRSCSNALRGRPGRPAAPQPSPSHAAAQRRAPHRGASFVRHRCGAPRVSLQLQRLCGRQEELNCTWRRAQRVNRAPCTQHSSTHTPARCSAHASRQEAPFTRQNMARFSICASGLSLRASPCSDIIPDTSGTFRAVATARKRGVAADCAGAMTIPQPLPPPCTMSRDSSCFWEAARAKRERGELGVGSSTQSSVTYEALESYGEPEVSSAPQVCAEARAAPRALAQRGQHCARRGVRSHGRAVARRQRLLRARSRAAARSARLASRLLALSTRARPPRGPAAGTVGQGMLKSRCSVLLLYPRARGKAPLPLQRRSRAPLRQLILPRPRRPRC